MNMTRIRNTVVGGLLALLLLLSPVMAFAQANVDHTTFAAVVTATQDIVRLTAASGVVANGYLYVDGELMRVIAVSGTSVTVRRGQSGGLTPARAHGRTSIVWVGGAAEFKTYNVSGACTSGAEAYLPHINTQEGRIFDCAANGVWIERRTPTVEAVRKVCPNGGLVCREEFNGGHLVMQDDGTAKSLTDVEENFVYGSPLGAIEYREEQTKTTSSWVTINGVLDISADDTTASEGVEIVFGASSDAALNQLFEVGEAGACIAASITIGDISQVTQLQIGFRQNEAFQDAAAYTGYARWNTIGLTTTNGAITSSQEVSSSTTTDLSGVTWADGERRVVKVCISAAGVPTAYYTAASPDNDAPIYRPITMTNSGVTQTSGTGMVGFLTFLAAGTTDAAVTIQWVELSYAP